MKIILKENIEKLGFKDEIVEVKNGYGLNFLIPHGKAILATENEVKSLQEKLRQQASKVEKEIELAKKIEEKLTQLNLIIKSKVQEDGKKIFGSISTKIIAEQISKLGIEIDKKFIKINSIKEIGTYSAEIRLHRELSCVINFDVVSA